ncbi:MAG: MauE/DoxX family redox-associated membrane protein [Ginsengibacter sp.]
MKKWIPDIISGLLILLFVYAAVAKLIDRPHFEAVLSQMLLIGGLGSFISIALPVTELLISALLLFPVMRLKGLYASLGLMILFTLYIGYMILFAKNLPCNCGGVLERMNWHQHLIFNLFFIILSVIGIKLYQSNKNIIAINRLPDQPPQGKS